MKRALWNNAGVRHLACAGEADLRLRLYRVGQRSDGCGVVIRGGHACGFDDSFVPLLESRIVSPRADSDRSEHEDNDIARGVDVGTIVLRHHPCEGASDDVLLRRGGSRGGSTATRHTAGSLEGSHRRSEEMERERFCRGSCWLDARWAGAVEAEREMREKG